MSQTAELDTVTINGVKYVREDKAAAPLPNGNRCVVVVDRGWIFAGDLTQENGRIYLDRAVHVRSWSEIGFDGVVDNPKSKNVTLKTLKHRVDLPAGAELFRVPVKSDWGL